MVPIGRPPQWVGREQELTILHEAVEALRRGEGAAISAIYSPTTDARTTITPPIWPPQI